MKLKAANITLKNLDGQSLYGNIVTQIGAEKDAAGLIAKALDGFPENYLEARMVGEPKPLEKTDSEATLAMNVEFAPSLAAYKTFATRLCQTLEASCKVKGEFSSVGARTVNGYGDELFSMDKDHGDFLSIAAGWMPEVLKGQSRTWTPDGLGLAVTTLVSKDSLRMEWKYYILDDAVGETVVRAFTRQAMCKISLLDAAGELVSVDRFDPRAEIMTQEHRSKSSLMQGILMSPPLIERENNRGYAGDFSDRDSSGNWKPKLAFFAPVLFWCCTTNDVEYVPKFTIPRTIKLSLDEVKRVAKVKCELTFRAGDDGKKK